MAEAAANISNLPRHNVVTISGRLDHSQQAGNGKNYSELTLPAPDAYSKPATVKIESRSNLGRLGETVTLDAYLTGFVRSFQTQDDKQRGGNQKTGRDVQMWLIAVDR
jgi:hypothetical protein